MLCYFCNFGIIKVLDLIDRIIDLKNISLDINQWITLSNEPLFIVKLYISEKLSFEKSPLKSKHNNKQTKYMLIILNLNSTFYIMDWIWNLFPYY